jgi:hypothetical protein
MASDVSARDLVNKVWEEVAAEQSLRPPPMADLGDYDRLVEDAERRYVNSHYALDRAPLDCHAGRPGRVKTKLRARVARFVVAVLGGYFDDEQEFLAHLVRLQNTITVEVDRLSEEVRKLEALLQAESERLRAADATLHARLEDRIRVLEAEVVSLCHAPAGGDR